MPIAKRPIHHWHLGQCLQALRVKPRLRVKGIQSSKECFLVLGTRKADERQLWVYLEEARNNHRLLIRVHHPDRGGSHEEAALLNAAWQRARELFARRGLTLNN